MSPPAGIQWLAAIPLFAVLLYILFVAILVIPFVQRHALYAHKIHSCFWHDLSRPEIFGFAKNQVQPLTIDTPDGEKLYAWHILPLDVYASNRARLSSDTHDTSTCSNLARSDPSARVIIFFHGNAGHVGQAWRTDTYRSFSALPHTHVLAIDYRGFGRSTGSPSEAGLITDGIAAVQYVLDTWRIPPSRIALVGHSLGTGVVSAVTLHFSNPSANDLLPDIVVKQTKAQPPTHFAGTLLIAPFLSIPELLLSYWAGGVVPLLVPLRPLKFLHKSIFRLVRHTWCTRDRLKLYFGGDEDEGLAGRRRSSQGSGVVRIIHSLKDREISFRQSEELYKSLTGEPFPWPAAEQGRSNRPVRAEARLGARMLIAEFVANGGHDRVCTYTEVNVTLREMLGFV